MDYSTQLTSIIEYFKKQEKPQSFFKIGAEFEYFVVKQSDYQTIDYNGVKNILKTLENKGYLGIYEGNHLLGLKKNGNTFTLEPGSQLELSIEPKPNIIELETTYKEMMSEVLTVINQEGYALMATGYQVKTKIKDLPLLPKKRYEIMDAYLSKKGKYAREMMRGTASLQISLDFESEADFSQKYRVLTHLTPILSGIFGNSPMFEGQQNEITNLRALIWDNCDPDRCGIVSYPEIDYQKYGAFILNCPPIFMIENNEVVETNSILFKGLYQLKEEQLEHALTMVFPDIRLKKYLEYRILDALPYPLNFGLIALIKGLIYHKPNLEVLDQIFQNQTIDYIKQIKQEMYDLKAIKYNGYSFKDWLTYLLELARLGLNEEEAAYLNYIICDEARSIKDNLINLERGVKEIEQNHKSLYRLF